MGTTCEEIQRPEHDRSGFPIALIACNLFFALVFLSFYSLELMKRGHSHEHPSRCGIHLCHNDLLPLSPVGRSTRGSARHSHSAVKYRDRDFLPGRAHKQNAFRLGRYPEPSAPAVSKLVPTSCLRTGIQQDNCLTPATYELACHKCRAVATPRPGNCHSKSTSD